MGQRMSSECLILAMVLLSSSSCSCVSVAVFHCLLEDMLDEMCCLSTWQAEDDDSRLFVSYVAERKRFLGTDSDTLMPLINHRE